MWETLKKMTICVPLLSARRTPQVENHGTTGKCLPEMLIIINVFVFFSSIKSEAPVYQQVSNSFCHYHKNFQWFCCFHIILILERKMTMYILFQPPWRLTAILAYADNRVKKLLKINLHKFHDTHTHPLTIHLPRVWSSVKLTRRSVSFRRSCTVSL